MPRSPTGAQRYFQRTIFFASEPVDPCDLAGLGVDRDRHVLDHEVKAVTQHGLSLVREGPLWVAELILDI